MSAIFDAGDTRPSHKVISKISDMYHIKEVGRGAVIGDESPPDLCFYGGIIIIQIDCEGADLRTCRGENTNAATAKNAQSGNIELPEDGPGAIRSSNAGVERRFAHAQYGRVVGCPGMEGWGPNPKRMAASADAGGSPL